MTLPILKEDKDLDLKIYFDGSTEKKFYEDISLDIVKTFEKLIGRKVYYLFISFGNPGNYDLYFEVGTAPEEKSKAVDYDDLYFELNPKKDNFIGGYFTRGASLRGKFPDKLLDTMIKKFLDHKQTRQKCNCCGREVSKNNYISNSGFCTCLK